MSCPRHPAVLAGDGLCPACLFEVALTARAAPWRLTVTMPLGASASSTVWLTRDERSGRLLRLKTWRTPPAEGFVDRIDALRSALSAWGDERVAPPLAAWTDEDGRAVVLSEFMRGVSLRDGLATAPMAPGAARALLDSVASTLDVAHARGLAHGSVGPGNVLVPAAGGPPQLLDFGVAIAREPEGTDWVAADRAGLDALRRHVAASLAGVADPGAL